MMLDGVMYHGMIFRFVTSPSAGLFSYFDLWIMFGREYYL